MIKKTMTGAYVAYIARKRFDNSDEWRGAHLDDAHQRRRDDRQQHRYQKDADEEFLPAGTGIFRDLREQCPRLFEK